MITIITKNQYTKSKINIETLRNYYNWFMTNEETWIHSYELEKLYGGNTRTYVNKLRCQGLPIISDTRKGYKLTANKTELKKCYAELRNRALRAITAAKLMKKQLA